MSSRRKVQDATGVDSTLPNVGHYQAWGRGAPLNGRPGFAPSCLYHNISGTALSALWTNIGTVTSSAWVCIDAGLGNADACALRHGRVVTTYDLASLGAKYFTAGTIPAGSVIKELGLQIVTTITTSGTTAALAMGDHAGSPVNTSGYPLTADLIKSTQSMKALNGDPLASDTTIDVCGTVADGSALGNGNITAGKVLVIVYFDYPPTLAAVA